MKKWRAGLAALLALVLLLGAALAAKAADSGFVIDQGVLMAYNGTATKITVPQGVRIIGRGVFNSSPVRDQITEVVLPDSVTAIETEAFMDCEKLKSITFSKGLEHIGMYAFSGCEALQRVTLPQSLRTIDDGAFYRCPALREIVIPGGVTYIGWQAVPVELCKRQGNFYVAGDGILMGAAVQMPNMVIPPNIKTIHQSAFETSSDWAFKLGDYLVSVVIPGSVKTIERSAFRYCQKLTSVTLGQGVETIDSSAFDQCSSLVEITVPSTVRRIGNNAFGSPKCGEASGRNVNGGYIPWLEAQPQEFVVAGDGVLIKYNGNSDTIVVPNGVKAIGGGVFSHYYDPMMPESWRKPVPVSVTLPESVTSIGISAFSDCYRLTEIELPVGLTEIGTGAFGNCRALTELNIPDGVTKIDGDTFSGCVQLRRIGLPDRLTEIGDFAFKNCTSLRAITFPAGLKRLGKGAFASCKEIRDFVLPAGLQFVDMNAIDNRPLVTMTVLGKDTRFDILALYEMKLDTTPEEERFLICAPEGAFVRGLAGREGIRVRPLPVATPNTAKILVDGQEVSFDAYLIGQNNYVKLRDLAAALTDTERRFNLIWEPEVEAVHIYPSQPYEFVGGELKPGDGQSKTAIPGTGLIYSDYLSGALKSYVIGGNNYVQLRNLAEYFNFRLGWDPAGNTITIDTSGEYQA